MYNFNAYSNVPNRNIAEYDFQRALRRATINRLIGFMRMKQARMQSYDEHRDQLCHYTQSDGGLQVIPMKKIVGSVGRSNEFDMDFMPLTERVRGRWAEIDMAYHSGKALPPIEVYEIGDVYYVIDGNHRISVFRLHGQEYTEAHVTVIQSHDLCCESDPC